MIKKIAFAGVGFAMLASPLLVSAQTASASSNTSLIAMLTALVQQLEQELQQLIAAKSPITTPQCVAGVNCQNVNSGAGPNISPCTGYANLKKGDTDTTTGGEVSQLQTFLGINPATGYYGALTSIGYNNKCVGGNSQPTSVAGMSEYTDSNFGFSFWYPSSWTVEKNLQNLGGIGSQIIIRNTSGFVFDVTEVTGSEITNSGHGAPEEKYYFDQNTGVWTHAVYAESNKINAADVSSNTMGGLHIFSWDSVKSNCEVVVPLSATNFLDVTDNSCEFAVNPITKTVVATNPNVATPISTAQQIATIQAEANAYGVSAPSTPALQATPTSGAAPLQVEFDAVLQLNTTYTVSFGDNSSSGSIDGSSNSSYGCHGTANAPEVLCPATGTPLVVARHTYSVAGIYTAQLLNGSTVIGTATITVTGSPLSSSLQTYTNSQYGFSLQYPANVSVQAPPSQQFAPGGTSLVAFGPVSANFAVTEPGWGTNGTVQISGNAYVNVTTKASDVANCMTVDTANATYTTIHGTQFLLTKSTDPAAGQEGYYHTYTALHNGACYSIDAQIMGVESGHMNAADGATNDAATAQLQSELDTIAQSFRFTQ